MERSGPASTSTRVMPSFASACSMASGVSPPSTTSSFTPRSRRSVAWLAAPSTPSGVVSTQVGCMFAPLTNCESSGMRSLRSATTRTPRRCCTPGSRTFSSGSSASTEPMPVSTASTRLRMLCPCARACSPVTQRWRPVGSAICPSAEVAIFISTSGSPCFTRRKNPRWRRAASGRDNSVTSMPASFSIAMPLPATRVSWSIAPTTTRTTPALISASAQGGVTPWCEQGSSVV